MLFRHSAQFQLSVLSSSFCPTLSSFVLRFHVCSALSQLVLMFLLLSCSVLFRRVFSPALFHYFSLRLDISRCVSFFLMFSCSSPRSSSSFSFSLLFFPALSRWFICFSFNSGMSYPFSFFLRLLRSVPRC